MTWLFWIIVALMIAAALAVVLPPLLRARHRHAASRQDVTVAVHRQRLAELEEQRAAGAIDEGAYEQSREDIERALLEELPEGDSPAGARGGRATPVAVGLAVPVIALGLYLALGNPDAVSREGTPSAISPQTAGQPPSLEEIVARLKELTARDPSNAQHWLMLAQAYSMGGRLEEARETFARAYELAPDSPRILVGYAEVLAQIRGNDMRGQPQRLVLRALQLAPNMPKALWLAGAAAFQRGDMTGAINHWERLQRLGTLGPQESEILETFIARARNEGSASAAATPKSEPAAAAVAVEVHVSLVPELASQVDPADPVFIFARAVDGPPMPVAVVRRTAGELPVTVVLDDSTAMAPQFKLSGFESVVVGARISKTGNATPSAGDLQGMSDPVAPAETPAVDVSITDVLR